jgi:hypothetical protein
MNDLSLILRISVASSASCRQELQEFRSYRSSGVADSRDTHTDIPLHAPKNSAPFVVNSPTQSIAIMHLSPSNSCNS